MTKRVALILAGVALLLVSACYAAQPTASPQAPDNSTSVVEPTKDSGYPGPGLPLYDPYPGVDNGETAPKLFATSGPAPAPSADAGVVIGKLLGNGQPATNTMLFLAEVQKDDAGTERVAAYDRATSPSAYVDAEGNFYFANIAPGRYGIVLDIVSASYLLNEPSSGAELLLTVTAGETIDLGILDYTDLPTLPK